MKVVECKLYIWINCACLQCYEDLLYENMIVIIVNNTRYLYQHYTSTKFSSTVILIQDSYEHFIYHYKNINNFSDPIIKLNSQKIYLHTKYCSMTWQKDKLKTGNFLPFCFPKNTHNLVTVFSINVRFTTLEGSENMVATFCWITSCKVANSVS